MPVFISHRTADDSKARLLAQRLRVKNIQCYLDDFDPETKATHEITRLIVSRINTCTHLMALVTNAKASPAIRVQIFNQAQLQRMHNWRDPDDVPKMELTIPIFRALIAADKENKFDRNHAQLGYALKDKREPDFAEAERELSEAIRIRGASTTKGLVFYELNRAYCRIMQDPDFLHGKKSSPESLSRILGDLRLAARAGLASILRGDEKIQKFLALNGQRLEDLANVREDQQS